MDGLYHSSAGGKSRRALSGLILLCVAIFSGATTARDNAWQQVEDNAAWRAECSGCHIAFPPALLPADDWLDIMSRLDKHYGVDASLEPKIRQEIAAYLERNGASNRLFGSRDEIPRITTTDWFFRKHQGAIRLWRKGKVKSLVECASCHKGPDIERMTGN